MYRKNKKDEYYTRRAREEGYPARSVYKLKEIDEKFKIFRKGDRVLDLGASPGSWMKYVAEKIGDNGKVIGVDEAGLKIPLERSMVFIKKSVMDLDSNDLGAKKFHAVVSDLSPKTTGIKLTDEVRSLELCEKAFDLALSNLRPGGNFVCKIFESDMTRFFFKNAKQKFNFVKRFRPKAVWRVSQEIYIVGMGFKQ